MAWHVNWPRPRRRLEAPSCYNKTVGERITLDSRLADNADNFLDVVFTAVQMRDNNEIGYYCMIAIARTDTLFGDSPERWEHIFKNNLSWTINIALFQHAGEMLHLDIVRTKIVYLWLFLSWYMWTTIDSFSIKFWYF